MGVHVDVKVDRPGRNHGIDETWPCRPADRRAVEVVALGWIEIACVDEQYPIFRNRFQIEPGRE
ncbi:MAG TPA: hypothetical protein VFQ15_07905 [Jiangellaceae bacterium]|nr:hypothetical protein [Jiangellaceae bacterium]